jgi:pimeloyl-ACP methyl ester carboxylesterase
VAAGLAVRETGAGPVVLLVHGWAGGKEAWGDLPTAIAEAAMTAVALDLPGWGESAAPRAHPHTAASYAEALADLVRERSPVGIVAHSMGTQAALVLAARGYRGRLALLAPPVLPARRFALPPKSLIDLVCLPLVGETLASAVIALMKRRPPPPPARYRRAVGDPSMLESPESQELVALGERLFATMPARVMARALRSTALADMRPVADGLTNPTLVVAGTLDRVVHPSEADVLVSRLPAGELLRVPTAGHLPHFEHPAVVIPAVVRHVADPT